MVRAILAGTKTQTRRVLKAQPVWDDPERPGRWTWHGRNGTAAWGGADHRPSLCALHHGLLPECPYGQPGDRLWVRETWRHTASDLDEARRITEDIASGTAVDYAATYIEVCMRELGFSREDAELSFDNEHWRPSIHMPRWACRLELEITGVRVERLQDISEEDAIAEGIAYDPGEGGTFHVPGLAGCCSDTAVGSFRKLWEEINGPQSWNANPWLWVPSFKRLEAAHA